MCNGLVNARRRTLSRPRCRRWRFVKHPPACFARKEGARTHAKSASSIQSASENHPHLDREWRPRAGRRYKPGRPLSCLFEPTAQTLHTQPTLFVQVPACEHGPHKSGSQTDCELNVAREVSERARFRMQRVRRAALRDANPRSSARMQTSKQTTRRAGCLPVCWQLASKSWRTQSPVVHAVRWSSLILDLVGPFPALFGLIQRELFASLLSDLRSRLLASC